MPEQREYIVEEIQGPFVAGNPALERMAELRREDWDGPVILPMQRLDGSILLVFIMSRPHKLEKTCLECREAFRVRDPRMKYCSSRCGARARYRRWKRKNRRTRRPNPRIANERIGA